MPVLSKRDVYFVEGEFHFLLVCPQFNKYRAECFLQRWKNMIPCIPVFYSIMSETGTDGVFALASFIDKASNYREELLTQQ